MESSPGLCRNTPSCARANAGVPIAVPLYDPFVCPQCGAALVPPALPVAPRSRLLPICLAAAMICAIVASAAIWRLGVERVTATSLASTAIPARPRTIALADLAPPPPLTVDAAPDAAAATARDLPAPQAALRPAPQPAAPALARIVCTTSGSVPQGCTDHRHRRLAAARTRRSTHLAAAPPAAVTQPSSTLALSSRPPKFPDQFYESDWMSTVTVDCLIAADGRPSACREKRREGSARFADAILDWLHNPATRFQPATRRGQDVAARRTWQIGFTP